MYNLKLLINPIKNMPKGAINNTVPWGTKGHMQTLRDHIPTGVMNPASTPVFAKISDYKKLWDGWIPSGKVVAGNITAVNQADGRTQVIFKDCNQNLLLGVEDKYHFGLTWHCVKSTNGYTWDWLDNDFFAAYFPLAKSVIYVSRGLDQTIWYAKEDFNWKSMGGVTGKNIAIIEKCNGSVEAFITDPGNALWHEWTTGTEWSPHGWKCFGGLVTGNVAFENNMEGLPELFTRGLDNALWHRRHLLQNGWSDWDSLGGFITSDPVCALSDDGRIIVFARGVSNELYYCEQINSELSWSGWSSLGGCIGEKIKAIRNADGNIEVFAIGSNGKLWNKGQNKNTWSDWKEIGGIIKDFTVCKGKDGLITVYAYGFDSKMYYKKQIKPLVW